MTPIRSLFTACQSRGDNKTIQIADGTLLTVVGVGTIILDPIGKLKHVLHIPKLFISLASVKKIASLILYKIDFDGIHAFLFDKVRGSKIGLVRVHAGLFTYHLMGTLKVQLGIPQTMRIAHLL